VRVQYLGVADECRGAGRVLEQSRRGLPALPPRRRVHPPPSPFCRRIAGGAAFDDVVIARGALRARGGVRDHGQVVLLRREVVVRLLALRRLAVETTRCAAGVVVVVVEVGGPAGLAAAAALGARRRHHLRQALQQCRITANEIVAPSLDWQSVD
jgi:hypothetical protein